jgi:L-xylulokinase
MGSYLLGLDAGNTVTKAVLFDLSGQQIAAAEEASVSLYPQPGHVERSLSEFWQQAATAIHTCIKQAGVDPEDILGVGCCGHGNGLYLLDKDQEPLLAIQSLDSRATEVVEKFTPVAEQIYDICLQKPWPSQTATLLAWLKRYAPETYSQAGTVFLCKDYLGFCLTGQIVSDVTDMSGAGLLRLPDQTYDQALLDLYGLEDCLDLLPPLKASTDVAGLVSAEAAEMTGLAVGTPMVAGLFDVIASATGAGTTQPGEASIVAGTWSINQVIVEEPVPNPAVFMAAAISENRYIEVEASATSAANLAWMVREFLPEDERPESQGDVFELCNDLVASVELTSGLPIYHPFIYGASDNGSARAGFYGIAGWHTRAHMIHAIYEGVVFGHLQHISTLREAGVTFDRATLSGGASRSPVWPQMFADVLNVEILVAETDETGALGAAIAAGVGLSIFVDLEAGAARMSSHSRRYLPDAARRAIYLERFRLYAELCRAMQPIWEALATE